MSNSQLNILICPLGWGLGHASRGIPIIEMLLRKGHRVIVAGDKLQLELIKQRFPSIDTIPFPSLKVVFTRKSNQLLPLLWIALRLPFFNLWEHFKLKTLLNQYKVDVVISDNRYGLWNKSVKTVIITHQLTIIPPFPFKWAMPITRIITKKWLSRFNQVWIPDFSGDNSIAGILSEPNGLGNLHYIGLLSRFSNICIDSQFNGFEMVVVASGPDPHRQIFIDISAKLAHKWKLNCLIIEGNPFNGIILRNIDGVWYVGHLPDLQFALAVKNSKYLIVRGGYSTVMDLLTLGVSGLIVPTPGQTEQEYLAEYLSEKGYFGYSTQSNLLNIDIADMQCFQINPMSVDDQLMGAMKELDSFR